MALGVYVASAEGFTAKSVVALGILERFKQEHRKIGIFRAIGSNLGSDEVVKLLLQEIGSSAEPEECTGVTYSELQEAPELAFSKAIARYRALEAKCDAVLVLGSDYVDVFTPTEFLMNARLAAHLGLPIVLTLNGRDPAANAENFGHGAPRSASDLRAVAEATLQEAEKAFSTVLAIIVNRADPIQTEQIKLAVSEAAQGELPVWVIPEDQHLLAPRMHQVIKAVGGELIYGPASGLNSEVLEVIVAAMTPEHVLQRMVESAVIVVPSDRIDVLLALLVADASTTFPDLAGIVLNGGFEMSPVNKQLIAGFNPKVPIIESPGSSFDITLKLSAARARIVKDDFEKVAKAKELAASKVDFGKLLNLVHQFEPTVITPLAFEYLLSERAKSANRTIVLPEGEDDRILKAAAQVIEKSIARLIILGDPDEINGRASRLGINLGTARILPIESSEYFEKCVAEYVKLRAHKNVTAEQARQKMLDGSYFGTMLVQLGIADGMVSGAVNTTAHTIKPAFEFIKTKPGVDVVSSVFLMALEDRVLVYGDCAVIPDPTAAQLADIAISSAQTATNFGITPRVAMLSYSTGDSGTGSEVDKVREATDLVHERAPQLSVEGPIQYDAAVDAAVAKVKLPNSSVAGKATVFVFPDLNTGNNTYKAVQRTSGAVAIGPILQGLKKPVNDLSRGALVADIVNTIAITAIQAGQE